MNFVNFIIFDFRENQLFFQTQGIVAAAVKGSRADTTEVTYAGQCYVHQFVKEIIHTVAAQGYFCADRHAGTKFKRRNGFLGFGDNRFLTGDDYEFRNCGFRIGDDILVEIFHNGRKVYSNRINYGKSFADVEINVPLIYMNSVYDMAVAINQGDFSKAYGIGVGKSWTITMTK